MKYTVQKLTASDQPHKYLFFWGHQPSKDGTITKTCFSQWWSSPFTVDAIEYKTAEHWMMVKKAMLFGDTKISEQILMAESPALAKKLGREVQNYDDAIWLKNRYEIVVEGNFHKFSQNPALKEFLKNTADRILAEASPVDAIWGIGVDAEHQDAKLPENWPGLNLLGFALMEVRDRINP